MEPTDPAPPATLDELAERIAREFHIRYEMLGPQFGWKTQESARDKDFEDLPPENRALMLATVKGLIEAGVIEPGAAVVETFREAGASGAR